MIGTVVTEVLFTMNFSKCVTDHFSVVLKIKV